MTGSNPILEQLTREHASPSQPSRPEARPVTVTRILQDVASNPLITRLAEHNLGQRLADHEADHICRLVAIIESGRHSAALPQRQPDTSQPQQQTAERPGGDS